MEQVGDGRRIEIARPLSVAFKRRERRGIGYGRPAHIREGGGGDSWSTVACFPARPAHGYLYVWADAIRNKYATNE